MVRYPFLMRAELLSPWFGCLIHEITGNNGARKAMHRATSPFVDVQYAAKTTTKQCQLFRKKIKISAFFIFSGLPLKIGVCRGKRKTPLGASPRLKRKCVRHDTRPNKH